jgi:hypothetical protein
MQKAIGHTNAPHPELEAELQQEYAKIVPKVKRGDVTRAEADHLHSLEARTHGHTERGGLTAIAQSVAARCERKASIGSGSDNSRPHANSRALTTHKQSQHSAVFDLPENEAVVKSNIGDNTVTQHEADDMHSREQRAYGYMEKSGISAAAQSIVCTRRYQSLSDSTNTTRASIEDLRKHSSMKSRLAGLSVHDEEKNISTYSTAFPKHHSYGSGDMGSGHSENKLRVHKRENSQSAT